MCEDYISFKEAVWLFETKGLSQYDLISSLGELRIYTYKEVIKYLENSDDE